MANAQRDQNYVTANLAESSAGDGALVTLYADPTTHRLKTDTLATNVETVPTSAYNNNPSFTLTYTGDNLTQVDMLIGATTYRKTLTYTGSSLTSVSAWSAV